MVSSCHSTGLRPLPGPLPKRHVTIKNENPVEEEEANVRRIMMSFSTKANLGINEVVFV